MLFGWLGLIFGFSGLIFVHELGHFLIAKWNGVRVHVFSLGMGPYLVSFTWHETVYVLSLIPLGGYVKMAGQDDLRPGLQESADPHDFRNKRPGQRAAILAAGAVFNIFFTLMAFAVCYRVGVDLEAPRIGLIMPNQPLAKATLVNDNTPAGLKEGDRILEVNGVPVKSFAEATMQIASSHGDEVYLRVKHQGDGIVYVKVQSHHDKDIGARGIGLAPYVVDMPLPLGFATKDIIILDRAPAEIEETKNGPAAQAGGFQRGDEIISIEGKLIEKHEDVVAAAQLSEGKPRTFVLQRNGERIEKTLTPEINGKTGNYWFGISPGLKRQVVKIDKNSEAYRKGLREGMYVFYFEPDETEWVDEPGSAAPQLVWKHGVLKYGATWDEKTKDFKSMPLTVPPMSPGIYGFTQQRTAVEHIKFTGGWLGFGEALSVAWTDTFHFAASVFTVLRGLFTRSVDTSALAGPIGVGHLVYLVASTKTGMLFLWYLAFISVNLGVLQFLPIPLLDGWHLLLILVEKLKGSPVTPRVQEAFQYVGLFIIGALLLLATYNDIFRIFLR